MNRVNLASLLNHQTLLAQRINLLALRMLQAPKKSHHVPVPRCQMTRHARLGQHILLEQQRALPSKSHSGDRLLQYCSTLVIWPIVQDVVKIVRSRPFDRVRIEEIVTQDLVTSGLQYLPYDFQRPCSLVLVTPASRARMNFTMDELVIRIVSAVANWVMLYILEFAFLLIRGLVWRCLWA